MVYQPDVWAFLEKREFMSLVEEYVAETGPSPGGCPICYSDVDLSVKHVALPCRHVLSESCLCKVHKRAFLRNPGLP